MLAFRSRRLVTALAATVGFGLVVGSAVAQKAGEKPAASAPKKGAKPARPSSKVDVAAAKKALAADDADAAIKAAASLGESNDGAAHDALLDALATGLHPTVASAVLVAIAQHPDAQDASTLAFYARYRDPDVRAVAADALGNYDGAAATRALIGALGDHDPKVRAAAAHGAGAGRVKATTKALMALLVKGDQPAAAALAAFADVELARLIGEQLGVVPDDLLAECLGGILIRSDFGPDSARVEVIRALAKIKGEEATKALAEYVSETPAKPPRQSRKEAESLVDERSGGDS
jgi:HEAT repeat protein